MIIVYFRVEKDFSLPLEMTLGGFVIPNTVRDLGQTELLPLRAHCLGIREYRDIRFGRSNKASSTRDELKTFRVVRNPWRGLREARSL
jgi:hypothetical protein